MTVVAIANQKGGVGKTTTAVTLAHGAALHGLNTLIIDLDSQGNVADSLGLESGNELYQLLINQQPLDHCTVQARENLVAIRADKTTTALKVQLSAADFREYALSNVLENTPYDLVIFDCAPSVDILHTAALVAADYLIVPTRLDQFAIKGVAEMVQSLRSIIRAKASNCQLAGIVPTFYDRTTRETQEQLENLASAFGSLVWPVVPADTACRVASRAGQTIWEYGPSSRAVIGNEIGTTRVGGYQSVLDRLMRLL
jgi:chromosome partitioning protein